MDMFDDRNMEHAAQGAVEWVGVISTATGDREKEKLAEHMISSQSHGRCVLASRDGQSDAQGPESATEYIIVGQAPDACSGLHPHTRATLQGRTEDRNSSTSGLHKGMEQEDEELPNGSTQLTSNPCASKVKYKVSGRSARHIENTRFFVPGAPNTLRIQ